MATYASDLYGAGLQGYVDQGLYKPGSLTTRKGAAITSIGGGGGGGGSWGEAPAQPSYGPSYGGAVQTPPVQTPTVPSAPGTGYQSKLASAIKTKAPAPAPVAPAPVPTPYNASQDAYSAGSNPSGMTAQQIGALAEAQMRTRVNNQSVANPGTLVTGAQMGATQNGQPINYQAYSYGAMPEGQVRSGFMANPTDPTLNGSKNPTNEALLARYKPEAVQGMYGGNEYSMTSAGLVAPDPRNFATPEQYQAAQDNYAALALQEQQVEANSAARQFVDSRNADQAAIDQLRQRVAAASEAQRVVANKGNSERQRLIQSLAARGLDPNTDTWAQRQIDDLDRLNREEQQAATQISNIELSILRTQAGDTARNALIARLGEIDKQKKAMVETKAAESKIKDDMLLAQATAKKDEAEAKKTESDISIADRQTKLAEARNPALIALDEARAKGEITDAAYQAGVATLKAQAETEKIKADTAETLALTPLKVKKLTQDINDAIASARRAAAGGSASSGTPVTDAETAQVWKALYETNGTVPDTKDVVAAVKVVKALNITPEQLKESGTAGLTNKTTATTRETGTTDSLSYLKDVDGV